MFLQSRTQKRTEIPSPGEVHNNYCVSVFFLVVPESDPGFHTYKAKALMLIYTPTQGFIAKRMLSLLGNDLTWVT